MTKLKLSKHIAADADTVFVACSDMTNAAERITGILRIEMLTDGPVGVGTRWRETRMMFKKEHSEEMEFTEFTPPQSYTVKSYSCGTLYESHFTFERVAGGTRVTMSFEGRPKTFSAKVMAPIGWLMMGTVKKMIDRDLEDLKKAIENGRADNRVNADRDNAARGR